jgi:hypothetical protein
MRIVKALAPSLLVALALAIAPFDRVDAQVTVNSADPSAAPQGTVSLDVTVNGNGFDSTAAVSFFVTGTPNPGGITVRKVAVKGSKRLVATIDIADNALVESFDIEVRLSNGRKGKGTTLFSVQRKPAINPAFTTETIQNYKEKMVTLQADGGAITTISNPLTHAPNPQHIPNPQWSPDGRFILHWDRWASNLVRIDSRTGAVQAAMFADIYLFPPRFDWSNTGVGSCGDLVVYSASTELKSDGFSREYDLFVTSPSLSQSSRLILSHELDDSTVGSDSDPSIVDPAWSPDGRFIVATSETSNARSTWIYEVACSAGINVVVGSETPLTLDFGEPVDSAADYAWSASGRYLALIGSTSSDADLWIADLGAPDQPGYPDVTPTMYRLTGPGRPFAGGPELVEGVTLSPVSDTAALVIKFAWNQKDLYTIDVGSCIAALGGAGSVAAGCAATLVPADINPHNVDWRPNWPTPLP